MKITTEKQFWDKVDKSGDCWEWRGGIDGNGYGYLRDSGKMTRAHRFIYALMYGFIPEGLCICHHCDNPICVKPSHLFLGTHRDNMRDCIAKGRFRQPDNRGENNGKSKLDENDVHEIRRLRSLGIAPVLLAKRWGVGTRNVNLIISRETWKHI